MSRYGGCSGNTKRRLRLPTSLALHGLLFYVVPDDDNLPLR